MIISSKVPQPIVKKLNEAIVEGLKAPDVAQRLAADGSTPVGSASADFNKYIATEIVKWKKLVTEANLPLQK